MSLTVEKCLQAWSNSLRQLNIKADIVFFGDSLTYYGDFASVFPNKTVCNLGLRGDTIQGLINRVEQVMILDPGVVYLMAGINDVNTCSLEQFGSKYESLLNHLISNKDNISIVVQGLLPVNSNSFQISCDNNQIIDCNKIIEKVASNLSLDYIDLFSLYEDNGLLSKGMTIDGIHLERDAYSRWYDVLRHKDV